MSDVVAVALITAVATLVASLGGILLNQRFERERLRASAREAALDRAHQGALQRREKVQEERRAQVVMIRAWIREQMIAGIDIRHLHLGTLGHGNADVEALSNDMRQIVEKLQAARTFDPTTMSINRAMAGVSNLEVVESVRELEHWELPIRAQLDRIALYVMSTPMPWTDEQLTFLQRLDIPLKETQRSFDEKLAAVNVLLELYASAVDLN